MVCYYVFGEILNNNVEILNNDVLQCGSMWSSALIGCFTVRLISLANTAGRKHREEIYISIFLSQLHRLVIIL